MSIDVYPSRPSGIWPPSASFPISPTEGDLFYETDTDKLWAYDGTNWVLQVASGAWDTYTPTWSALSVGNGTTSGRWTRQGRKISFDVGVTLGSTSVVSTADFTLPVTMNNTLQDGNGRLFSCSYKDVTGAGYVLGSCDLVTNQRARLMYHSVSGSLVVLNYLSSTTPFTWASGDKIYVHGSYEALASS